MQKKKKKKKKREIYSIYWFLKNRVAAKYAEICRIGKLAAGFQQLLFVQIYERSFIL